MSAGSVVFYGETKDALDYFANLGLQCPIYLNPADFLLDVSEDARQVEMLGVIVVAGVESEEKDAAKLEEERFRGYPIKSIPPLQQLVSSFASSSYGLSVMGQINQIPEAPANVHDVVEAYDRLRAPSAPPAPLEVERGAAVESPDVEGFRTIESDYLRKTWILTQRSWVSTVRDSNVMYVRSLAAIGIGALVGGIFFQLPDNFEASSDRVRTILFLMCVFILFGLPAVR